ncbi:MAG: hypothetical protein CMJ78_27175 [Planctomycetaceae bacterium]|nr:hypothetical protein [Planctomycetaceae bacterium]
MLQKVSSFLAVSLLLWSSCAFAKDQSTEEQAAINDFNKSILPILRKHCYGCHSHQAKKAKGGLVLDSRSGWARGGETGPAIVPGKPDESLLISAVRYEDYQMPPKGKLPEATIKKLEQWIAKGAVDPRVNKTARQQQKVDIAEGRKHWAFQPVAKAAIPEVQDDQWPKAAMDRFILAKLEQEQIRPVIDADRHTWLRRVSFDLTGLPPSVDQIQDFLADESPQAKEKVVDRLLNSKGFGERWARHWLDLVGYADQVGTSNRVFAQYSWKYRDYVINAFNNDKSFDEFIRQQIAGDLLPHDSPQQRAENLTATGFLVLGDVEIVEADKEKLLVDIVDQQLNKVGKAFLGLTLECARCHDHKFDPIPQTDYYAMGGFFHGTSTIYKTPRGVWSDIHKLDLPETKQQTEDRMKQQKAHAEKLAGWKKERSETQARQKELDQLLKNDKLTKGERDKLTKERDQKAGRVGQLNRDIEHAEFFKPTVAKAHGVFDAENPKDMRVTIRGNPRALGRLVPRGFLQVASDTLPKIPAKQSGRAQLAQWIADGKNPLTARVCVNRIWQKLFAEGLVRTVDYFGLPGDRPSHPELLDFLAARFVASGWSQKKLIRNLVLSRTYGLASTHSKSAHAIDPDNRWLWRMNRVRLDAEAMRDAMIFVAGQLQPPTRGSAIPLEYAENVGGLDPKNVNPPNF